MNRIFWIILLIAILIVFLGEYIINLFVSDKEKLNKQYSEKLNKSTANIEFWKSRGKKQTWTNERIEQVVNDLRNGFKFPVFSPQNEFDKIFGIDFINKNLIHIVDACIIYNKYGINDKGEDLIQFLSKQSIGGPYLSNIKVLEKWVKPEKYY